MTRTGDEHWEWAQLGPNIYLQVQSQLPIETYDKRIASDSKPKQKSEFNTIQKRDKWIQLQLNQCN